jgi:hypothetical protein
MLFIDQITEDPINFRAYSEVEEFLDDSAIWLYNCPFCYQVTAIYSSPMDWCESGASNEDCVICPLGIKEEQNSLAINIYPNPASDVLYIEAEEEIEGVSIFDGRGITIEQLNNRTIDQPNKQSDDPAMGHLVEVSLNGLAPGLYLVRVETGSGVIGRKVVVRR